MSRHSSLYWLLAVLGAAMPAQALNIVLTDTGASPMSTAQFDAFTEGASFWEDVFSDPITVSVNVAFSDPDVFSGPTVLGDTLSRRTTHNYADVRSAMFSDAAFGTEKNTVSALPAGASGVPLEDINNLGSSRIDNLITLSSANAKALGLGTAFDGTYGTPPAGSADARIRFNTNFASQFDFDRSDGTPGNKVDFVTVAAHEIGHALGFSSVTDVQDAYPSFTLHPNTLDLYRFNRLFEGPSDIRPHSLTTTVRKITAGPASYYDGTLEDFPPYTPFSLGVTVVEPNCNTGSGRCQASHWRDDQALLMDPTLANGDQVDPTAFDIHALNYVGYSRQFTFFAPAWKDWFVKWFPIRPLEPFPSNPRFKDFARPVDPRDLKPPFEANLVAQIGMDLDLRGMDNRSATAFVRFADEKPNPDPEPVGPVPTPKGQQDLTPMTHPVKLLPPTILDLYFVSDKEAGEQFTFTDSLGEGGAQLDPNLGKYGGYRITGFVDSAGDGVEGDVDAMMTVELLADENGIPNPEENNFFTLAFDLNDSLLTIIDPSAKLVTEIFGDYTGNGLVEQADLDLVLLHWGDPDTPIPDGWVRQPPVGKIDQAELDVVLLNWGHGLGTTTAVPEPSCVLILALGTLISLATIRSNRRGE